MKGIILAGDQGSRLHPLTLGIPKQLIPIYDKPMIYYPINTLVQAGVKDILIISTTQYQPLFQSAIGNSFDANFTFAIQDTPKGIAEAITISKDFIGDDGVCLITGDTIIEGDGLNKILPKAFRTVKKSGNATIFVEGKTYPDQYGKVLMNDQRKVTKVDGDVDSSHYYSIASLYVFPNSVIKHAAGISPSERGRLEIVDVNKRFFDDCKLQVQILDSSCKWFDTNSFNNILSCAEYMKRKASSTDNK